MLDKISIRNITESDTNLLLDMAKKCPPLDVHTPYTYWIVCNFFQDYTFVISIDNEIAGYIMAVSNNSDVVIWQLCVIEKYRRNGLAQLLINAVVKKSEEQNKGVQLSMLPDNYISYNTFMKYCMNNNKYFKTIKEISINDHKNEIVFRIENIS